MSTTALVSSARRMMSSSSSSTISRKRLLEVVRGVTRNETDQNPRILRCFPLNEDQVRPAPQTPSDFHNLLCERIRNASRRVKIASLYIGPAVQPDYEKEVELLDALRQAAQKDSVNIQILLDLNRALRRVSVANAPSPTTTTSAQACLEALVSSTNKHSVHLLSVLPRHWQYTLPNPLNEVAGVFHIKIYVIDDEVILSGANLSEEYFSDRIDRYLHIYQSPIVDWYADVVEAFCDYGAVRYTESTTQAMASRDAVRLAGRQQRKNLMDSLGTLFTTTAVEDADARDPDQECVLGSPVAYVVPTLQMPSSYFSGASPVGINTHERILHDLLSTAATALLDRMSVRFATAYLNPTRSLLEALSSCGHVDFLTAGRMSHGFKPSKKAGNKGKDWIPDVFELLAKDAERRFQHVAVSYYSRPEWTFHAKGMWLTASDNTTSHGLQIDQSAVDVLATVHGSGNFGQRSAVRDLESNLILILPPKSPLAAELVDEWNGLCHFAVSSEEEESSRWQHQSSIPGPVLARSLPLISSFF